MTGRPDKLCYIRLEDVSVKIGASLILNNVNATIEGGKINALIGPNGAGKTTLLSAILGLIPYTGKIVFCDEDSNPVKKPRIGYVPQRFDFDPETPITVLDFLTISEKSKPLWFWQSKRTRLESVEILKQLNAQHLLYRPLGKLSGGEFQRVVLATTIKNEPEIILLDEPVSGIDVAGEEMFCELLTTLQEKEKFTLVLVSHDISVVNIHADKVICLNKTVINQGEPADVINSANLCAMYGSHVGLHYHKKNHFELEKNTKP